MVEEASHREKANLADHRQVSEPVEALILPGWQGSGADHWQTHWEMRYGYQRLEQHDWQRPLRGDWMMRLEETLLARDGLAPPLVLIAHSLGCHLVTAWAAISRQQHRVRAALLVAPPDIEVPAVAGMLHSWSPIVLERLPFASRVIASSDDPFAPLHRSIGWADAWGSACVCIGKAGHINAEAGFGQWEAGQAQLKALLAQPAAGADLSNFNRFHREPSSL
jgi:predicted alpha/beta hydrolase family esterase